MTKMSEGKKSCSYFANNFKPFQCPISIHLRAFYKRFMTIWYAPPNQIVIFFISKLLHGRKKGLNLLKETIPFFSLKFLFWKMSFKSGGNFFGLVFVLPFQLNLYSIHYSPYLTIKLIDFHIFSCSFHSLLWLEFRGGI